ncbi:autotransporter outer membrane beta-barrel domain-containing protein [Microvirga antarctica]|uniref:autotransporter family protein n=1 Tax=Microvirga antarctica TaxID=2819233 RepID=UPI001B303AA1
MNLFTVRVALISTVSSFSLLGLPDEAAAGCAPSATNGDDMIVCNILIVPDPVLPPVDLLSGNDQVRVESGTYSGGITGGAGTKVVAFLGGTIANYTNTVGTSAIVFETGSTSNLVDGIRTGAGADSLTVRAGSIGGAVNQGDGADTFLISGGTVSGVVSQGNGIDTFTMTAGQIQSLAQGDNRDIFLMTGGTILGFFEDGDVATMSGGTIGRVDMKLDNNIFNLSDGAIRGNLVTGFGNDIITMSGGSVGGNISVSGGADVVTITGGSVGGDVRLSTGTDVFTWSGGGAIEGVVDLGPDDDRAILRDLTSVNLAATDLIDGGQGDDTIFLGGILRSFLNASIVANFETLIKDGSGTWSLSGSLRDIARAEVREGTLILTGDNSAYPGQMIVRSPGTLEGRAQTLTLQVANAGLVRFNQPDFGIYNGQISGAGAVEKTGTGTTVFTTDQTYTGGTTITEGTLRLGNGSPSGMIAENVVTDGTLSFARPDIVSFPGVISGSGNLSQIGTGTVILTSDNTYSGGTLVQRGTLAVGGPSSRSAALSGGGSVLIASNATLGGYGSITGPVTNNGTLAVADALVAFASNPGGDFTINGTLSNGNLVQIGGAKTGNRLLVDGYVGNNGIIGLNTFLGTDDSPSDRLVVRGGSATGSTTLAISNLGGPGAQTNGNGILVVDAVAGARTDQRAFSLSGPVAAGAYEYFLFRGGVTRGANDNWYLRNTVVAPPPAVPGEPPLPPPTPAPDSPPLPSPSPGSQPVPLFRVEVPVYSVVPVMARELVLSSLGTFHERQGDQTILNGQGTVRVGWGRIIGESRRQDWSGPAAPKFDGNIWGLQTGLDLYGVDHPDGARDKFGAFFGYARAHGEVSGFALGSPSLPVGSLETESYSVGAYWTHLGASGWYVDTVLMGSRMSADPRSLRGVNVELEGRALTASVEAGYPMTLGGGIIVEPQAQIIWQSASFDSARDPYSTIAIDPGSGVKARLGARIKGSFASGEMVVEPYLKANFWHDFAAKSLIGFDPATALPVRTEGSSLEIGGGAVAKLSSHLSIWATGSYTAGLGDDRLQSVRGDLGLRVTW